MSAKKGDIVHCKDETGQKISQGTVCFVYTDGTFKIRFDEYPNIADRKHVPSSDIIFKETLANSQVDVSHCKGIKANGDQCMSAAKFNGYCGRHSKSPPIVVAHPPHVQVITDICKGLKVNGDSCTSPAKFNGFCGRHSAQSSLSMAAPLRTNPPEIDVKEATSLCQALQVNGKRCTSESKIDGYCGRHLGKHRASSLPTVTVPQTPPPIPVTASTIQPICSSAIPTNLLVPDLARVNTADLQHTVPNRLMPPKTQSSLRMASWNLLHLSEKTADAKKCMRVIRRVIHEVDFCALQEIVDENVVPSLVNDLGDEWDYCQQRISTKGGIGSAEHYAFVWRRCAILCLCPTGSSGGRGAGGYIVKGHKDRAAVETFFHRPPLVATFQALPGGFIFTAVTIHVTFDGRPKEYEPTKVQARRLETENLAALAYALESDLGPDGTNEIDRVLIMGDFNLPARMENFSSLLGPVLNYVPCLDPETSPPSMLSKGGLDVDGNGDMDSPSPGGRKKKKEVPGDFLYDNIISSLDLGRAHEGRCGGNVQASGVCDLVKLIDDFDMPQLRGEAIEANGLELEVKRMILKRTVSDHMPVYADFSIGSGYAPSRNLILPETHIEIVRTMKDGKFGQQYEAIAVFGHREGAKRRAAAAAAAAATTDENSDL